MATLSLLVQLTVVNAFSSYSARLCYCFLCAEDSIIPYLFVFFLPRCGDKWCVGDHNGHRFGCRE